MASFRGLTLRTKPQSVTRLIAELTGSLPWRENMRHISLVAIVIVTLMPPLPARAANVNCSCPSVAADGIGNTSCSTAESNGRCTIDFNTFGAAREERARD